MRSTTRVRRHRRLYLSATLTGVLALGATGPATGPVSAAPAYSTPVAPVANPPVPPIYAQPGYSTNTAAGTAVTTQPNTAAGTAANQTPPPVGTPGTAINSAPANSAAPFPQDIYRFSQSGAVRTPAPMPSTNIQVFPFTSPTPNPSFPR